MKLGMNVIIFFFFKTLFLDEGEGRERRSCLWHASNRGPGPHPSMFPDQELNWELLLCKMMPDTLTTHTTTVRAIIVSDVISWF